VEVDELLEPRDEASEESDEDEDDHEYDDEDEDDDEYDDDDDDDQDGKASVRYRRLTMEERESFGMDYVTQEELRETLATTLERRDNEEGDGDRDEDEAEDEGE